MPVRNKTLEIILKEQREDIASEFKRIAEENDTSIIPLSIVLAVVNGYRV